MALTSQNYPQNEAANYIDLPSVAAAIDRDATSALLAERVAASMGLNIEYAIQGGRTTWKGAAWLPALPWLRYELEDYRSSEVALRNRLQAPRAALLAAAKASWLSLSLAHVPAASVKLEDAAPWKASAVTQLYNAERVIGGGGLGGDTLPAATLAIAVDRNDYSRWFVLSGGSLLLFDYNGKTVVPDGASPGSVVAPNGNVAGC